MIRGRVETPRGAFDAEMLMFVDDRHRGYVAIYFAVPPGDAGEFMAGVVGVGADPGEGALPHPIDPALRATAARVIGDHDDGRKVVRVTFEEPRGEPQPC